MNKNKNEKYPPEKVKYIKEILNKLGRSAHNNYLKIANEKNSIVH